MASKLYDSMKTLANSFTLPCAIFSVEKKDDGSCGEVRFFAINKLFTQGYYDLFSVDHDTSTIDLDTFHTQIEGKPYYTQIPKEPNFEDICFRAAWSGEHIHIYVDTTKMYGFWTEDILMPVNFTPEYANVSYCIFMYTLNKEMDTGKYSAIPPDVSSFVLKTCLELRNEKDFYSIMDVVTKDLREYSDSFVACILSINNETKTFEIISESMRERDKLEYTVKEIFSKFPYRIVASWEKALSETNSIIIKNPHDMDIIAKKAPEWVKTLKDNNVETLALVPFIHQGVIIGYLYLTGFETENLVKVKEAIELVAFFLTSEIANHLFMEQLEYLSNIDILTGVYNRNRMNNDVDEFSTRLKLNPTPFSVAFCDLNGLKAINDNGGHSAGDRLLKDAANTLKEVFWGDSIYRAGGDEFAIISMTSTADEFEEKIKILREKASDPDWLNFAIGHYNDLKGHSLRKAMRYADERMYKDKKAYYKEHPEKKR
ncbi:MAG: GGDEF domain-containing protein [Pseudobutyrivibrio sp.]|nr:GGDEF domain-containing protein [Pseudobutyrivibrio sp.]